MKRKALEDINVIRVLADGGIAGKMMYSVFDREFAAYGRVISGYDNEAAAKALDICSPLPAGVQYVMSDPGLDEFKSLLSSNEYGGMPIQLGWCSGHNTKLNCLEYHKDSEINLGVMDFILLLAKIDDIEDGSIDSSKVKTFFCPAKTMIEIFSTSLHYAPCSAGKEDGFKVMIVLPEGTNGPKPQIDPLNSEDELLWARNKWLLAHIESDEAKQGAKVGITGVNIDIAQMIQ